MKASQIKEGRWLKVIGTRVVRFWLDADGFHFQSVDDGVPHKEEVMSYEDALAKAEKQMTLI